MPPDSTNDQILTYLANHADRSFRPKELAKKLGITDNSAYRRFRSDLQTLIERRAVNRQKGGRVQHQRAGGTPEGTIAITARGFGFVSVPGSGEDVYVSASNTGTALDGDLVRLEIFARNKSAGRRGRGPEGSVVEVLKRSRRDAVGTYKTGGRLGYVEPDDQRLTRDIYVEDALTARHGDKVVVTIDRFDDHRGSPEGRVVSVIGPGDDPSVRVASLAMSLGVRIEYPEIADREAQANASARSPAAHATHAERTDLIDKLTVTIDPDDAKDFDDAIGVERLPKGGYRAYVHVADVAHYVDADTPLDSEAYTRGTSCYLVDRVVPMLPEVLSAEACSLRPDELKYALTCIVELDDAFQVVATEVCESTIKSRYRLTYSEAQGLIAGEQHEAGEMIQLAAQIARALRERRVQDGSIQFDLPEVKVVLDEAGLVTDIRPRERLEAHRLIEEFMLLANRSVAEWMTGRPFVYRLHASPDADKLSQVARYVSVFGHDLNAREGYVPPRAINALLSDIRGTPQEPIIQGALLRAMAKAEYGTTNIGHFGLAIEHYTHFTSPIRRYPDLIVHRLVKSRLAGPDYREGEESEADQRRTVAPAPLKEACRHCSERERVAVDAERASVRLKQVEYARNHIGDTFAGVISGVSQFGVFVQLSELLVDGLVHVRDIGDDYYEYDEESYALIGSRTGRVFQVGQQVSVTIVRADTEAREIDLFFADSGSARARYAVG